jgi:hypothetical protein
VADHLCLYRGQGSSCGGAVDYKKRFVVIASKPRLMSDAHHLVFIAPRVGTSVAARPAAVPVFGTNSVRKPAMTAR